MGLRVGAAYLDVLPRVGRGFDSDLEKQVTAPMADVGKKSGNVLSGALKSAVVGGGVLLAATGAKEFLTGTLDAARESNKIAAQTEAVIKSTGGAAGLTAAQFGDLAESIARKTGVDDEAIQSAQNLLATFTNVRNEAGKGKDVFSQATEVLVDMGAALGTDARSSAVQLGKALNDPIKGITALSRVGVTFTDQQKEQIRTMQEAGDMAGAQAVILAELRKEFGGSAEAQATAADKLKVSIGNIQEEIGARLVPIVDKAATWLADRLPGALDVLGRAGGRLLEILRPVFDTIVKAVESFLYTFRTGFSVEDVATPVERIAFFVRDTLWPILQRVGAFIADNLKPILIGLGVAFVALTSPVSLIVGALVLAYTKSETFRKVIGAVVGFITDKVMPAFGVLASYVVEQIGSLVEWWKSIWPQVSEAIGHVLNVVSMIVAKFIEGAKLAWRLFGDDLFRVIKGAFDIIRNVVEVVLDVIAGVIRTVVAVINGDWGKAWQAIKDTFGNVWDGIVGILRGAWDILSGIFGGIFEAVRNVLGGVWDWLKGHWEQAIQNVKLVVVWGLLKVVDFLAGFAMKSLELGEKAFGWIPGIGDKIRQAQTGLNVLKDTATKTLLALAGIEVGSGGGGGGSQVKFLAAGGDVTPFRPHVVGEDGPELFIPRTAGMVVSNGDLSSLIAGAAGSGDTYNFEFHGATQMDEDPRVALPRAIRQAMFLAGR
jgi:phage-related protein